MLLDPRLLPLLAVLSSAALPHAPGERMDFAVDYLGVPVGRARIQVGQPEGALLPVFLQARTTGVLRAIEVREQLATHLEVDTGLPRSATLDAVEPGYSHRDRADFDRAAGAATVREVGKRDKTTRVEVPEGTVDFVAMVFQLRTLPLEDGASHPFSVLAGTKVSRVVARVVGRERLETGAGVFPAVKVLVPTGFGGQFSEKNPTFLWLSDDGRRIVLRIVTEFRIGRATAELTAYAPGAPPDPAPPVPAGG